MPLTPHAFHYVQALVHDRAALVLEPGKEYLVESRLHPLARRLGFPTVERMIDALRSRAFDDLHRSVVDAMTTNETSFFRDVRVFEMFRNTILPAVVARRTQTQSLNIWCAACSSGQEPYSLAMLLREHVSHLTGWRISLTASDLSREMLAQARAGCYSQIEVNRGLPAAYLVKYFRQRGASWEISADIRQMVEFREINLVDRWPVLPRMDVVFIRNVLIYFDLPARKRVLGAVHRLLDPAGYVVLGGAETAANVHDSFECASTGGASCFRPRGRDAA